MIEVDSSFVTLLKVFYGHFTFIQIWSSSIILLSPISQEWLMLRSPTFAHLFISIFSTHVSLVFLRLSIVALFVVQRRYMISGANSEFLTPFICVPRVPGRRKAR